MTLLEFPWENRKRPAWTSNQAGLQYIMTASSCQYRVNVSSLDEAIARMTERAKLVKSVVGLYSIDGKTLIKVVTP